MLPSATKLLDKQSSLNLTGRDALEMYLDTLLASLKHSSCSEDVEVPAGLGLSGVAPAADLHVEDLVQEAEHAPAHLLPAVRLPASSVRGPGRSRGVIQWCREISWQMATWLSD